MNLRPKLEKIAVLVSIAVILWTARLAVIFILGDHWFDTLGVTSILFGLLTYLSWKDKLGKFGRIYKGILTHKIAKKLTKIRLGFAFFVLAVFGTMSAGMHASNAFYHTETAEFMEWIESENPNLADQQKVLDEFSKVAMESPEDTAIQTAMGMLVLGKLAVTDFEVFSTRVGASNMIYGGQLIHFVDIIFVEELEILGILFLVSYLQRKTKTLTHS